MKLWRIIQWGNPEEGVNGHDTQCVISAVDMHSALKKASIHFGKWRDGKADVVNLLGEDNRPDGEPLLVIAVWIAPGYNLQHDPSWHRDHETNDWVDGKTLFSKE